MANKHYTPDAKRQFWKLVSDGWPIRTAGQQLGISPATAYKWYHGEANALGTNWRDTQQQRRLPDPKQKLIGEASYCYHDFQRWRERYLGRKSTPWQLEAANSVVEWLKSDESELAVINCPPGSGKSTLFTHDIPTWLICRDRSIRIMIGSANLRLAAKYSGRIRRTLERTRALPEAQACLAAEYGRFKPEVSDIWRMEEFVVMPIDGSSIEDKEPTVSAFGMESEFLGTRANFVVWDDLVTTRTMATEDKIEKMQDWWDNEGETRLEPGGCLLLQGQRMGSHDLYRYALDQSMDEDLTGDTAVENKRYRHIVYPAHFEDRCENLHYKEVPPWPAGCLLDPYRLPWLGKNGLGAIKRNKESKFQVQYQQEDMDPEDALIQQVWIQGGRDRNGHEHPGCYDDDRGYLEIPNNLAQPVFSIATADPSPTKYWSVQWWLYQPDTEYRYFMDMYRGKLDAPDFLDWLAPTRTYVGLMDEWQQRSRDMGYPITHWIIENNAAQRYLLQYEFTKRWARFHRVTLIGHNTNVRKLDEDYGLEMLKNTYQYGLCRFPRRGYQAVDKVKQLVNEATHYPDAGVTDDCLMAQWFLEYNLPSVSRQAPKDVRQRRPSWMKKAS